MAPQTMVMPPRGSCVGYEIRSRLTFQTLRAGGGTPLYIEERTFRVPTGELVQTWMPRPGNPFHGRLLKDGSRFAFWASDAGWYYIDPAGPSISLTPGANSLRRELRLFGVPTAICTFSQGDIAIHASAVEIFGKGVLLAGPSRYGKTTLAAAFARAGHRLLSEDSTRCSTSATGGPSIFPGPAAIRLRADVAPWLTVPGARAAAAEEGRVPLVIDEQLRGDGAPVQLQAIFILRENPGATLLEPAPAVHTVRDLLALTSQLPDPASRAACFSRVTDLAARVPTFNLYRRMTMESLDEVVTLVERQLSAAD